MMTADEMPDFKAIEVLVNVPVNMSYTYRASADMGILPGMRVTVDFAGRLTTAYVTAVKESFPEGITLKDVVSRVDDEPFFDERVVKLAEYVSWSYISSTGEAIARALPAGVSAKSRRETGRVSGFDGKKPVLTAEQEKIFNAISESEDNAHLIFGVTGSGKTEIYIKAALEAISRGESVIYLLPEITLSSQIHQRLYRVFGDDLVLYHSRLTPNQRFASWKKFYSGEAKIAVGTRSSVFMQCPRLGLIIVDEEHDSSYKEQSTPRYNARRIAFYRSQSENAKLILGSATPSVETLYAAERGRMTLHKLDSRYGEGRLPRIEIVKLKSSREEISSRLKMFTSRAVNDGNQAVYMLNRRGFAPFVLCGDCGSAVECPDCSIGMNFHRGRGMLCHYCGYEMELPSLCRKCGSGSILKLGSGTQKIEEVISAEFPDFRIFRLDQDNAAGKDTAYELVEMMEKGEIDLLLGTQMISKGFDFHGVTVAGILLADIGLNMPDFRSTERIFSLLMQLAGRSGRGEKEGVVIIQTLNDSHPIFDYLRRQDYMGFYRNELEMRRALNYPPFSRLARIVIRGKVETEVGRNADLLAAELRKNVVPGDSIISVLGPSSAPLSKIGGNFRYHIIVKGKNLDGLTSLIRNGVDYFKPKGKGAYIEIDIDPVEML